MHSKIKSQVEYSQNELATKGRTSVELILGRLCPASQKLSDITVTTKQGFRMASKRHVKLCFSILEWLHRYAQRRFTVFMICTLLCMCRILAISIEKNGRKVSNRILLDFLVVTY